MEVIMTQFSPREKVEWTLKEKRVRTRTEHKIEYVKVTVARSFVFASGLLEFVSCMIYSFQAVMTQSTKRKKELVTKIDDNQKKIKIDRSKTVTVIKYKLSGVKDLVKESELSLIKP